MFSKPLFLAEVALSHDGSVGNACSLIKLAKENNIDIVKFQDHWAKYESSNQESFRVNMGIDKTRYDYWERTGFSFEEWSYIYEFANKLDMNLGFSVFSEQSFFRQKKLGNSFWKIGSGELLNDELIEIMIHNLGKEDTVVLSIGLSDFNYGLKICKKFSNIANKVYLLECISEYPCDLNKYNMQTWLKNYSQIGENIFYGLSDHSGTIWPTIFSWSCGASLNEFHITFNKDLYGPDQKASLDPLDLQTLSAAKDAYIKLNSDYQDKDVLNKEKMKRLFGRSIGLRESLKKGHKIERNDLIMRKPAGGFEYNKIDSLLGKVLNQDVEFKELLKPSHFV
tara:strand:+ start:129 stop:1142 length:1014 start_codon:yes stop_codon:yes gene_type:complete